MGLPTIWTDELRARVTVLWPDHSASQISGILASEGNRFSRNSIVGIVHRMNLGNKTLIDRLARVRGPRQPAKSRPQTYLKTKPSLVRLRVVNYAGDSNHARTIKTIDAVMPALRRVETESRNLTLQEIADGECHYIERNDRLYCGHPQKPGSSYCPAHHEIMHEPPNPAKAKARKYFGTDFARGVA
jgi:hypothetical protein